MRRLSVVAAAVLLCAGAQLHAQAAKSDSAHTAAKPAAHTHTAAAKPAAHSHTAAAKPASPTAAAAAPATAASSTPVGAKTVAKPTAKHRPKKAAAPKKDTTVKKP
jgi:hypothetical protein